MGNLIASIAKKQKTKNDKKHICHPTHSNKLTETILTFLLRRYKLLSKAGLDVIHLISLYVLDPNPHDFVFKVVLTGESGVGKSAFFHRFCDGTFVERPHVIGPDFRIKIVFYKGIKVKLQMWDLPVSCFILRTFLF